MKTEEMQKPKVLLVDDDLGMQETLSDILGALNYDVTTAKNGMEGVEKFRQGSYSVVLMDIKMPGMNGIEACKKIKAIKPETKIILITAYALDSEVREIASKGIFSVLYKPLDIEKMLKLIEAKNG